MRGTKESKKISVGLFALGCIFTGECNLASAGEEGAFPIPVALSCTFWV